jgi:hypothetical protein
MSVENASEFAERTERSNEAVLRRADLPVKRFFALGQDMYEDGARPKKTKELLGPVSPTVLSRNDCTGHHLPEVTAAESDRSGDRRSVGDCPRRWGAITISHLRHAYEVLESVESKE